jgi:amino acid transporter
MYPVSGGTARFPHFAFGSLAGVIIAVPIGTLVYTLLEVVMIGAMPANLVGSGWTHFSDATIKAGPFAGLAGAVGLGWLASILRVDAFISGFEVVWKLGIVLVIGYIVLGVSGGTSRS